MKLLIIIYLILSLCGFNASLYSNTTDEGRESIRSEFTARYEQAKRDMIEYILDVMDLLHEGACFSRSNILVNVLRDMGYHAKLMEYKCHFYVHSEELGLLEAYPAGNIYGKLETLQGRPAEMLEKWYTEFYKPKSDIITQIVSPICEMIMNSVNREIMFGGCA